MKTNKIKKLLASGVAGCALSLAAGPATAVTDIYLGAQQTTVIMPDGVVVPVWVFVEDPAGPVGCIVSATPIACVNALTPAANPAPGPKLDIPIGETMVNIHVTNALPEPVSVVIPGQAMPTPLGPTWDDNTTGARTNVGQRVRSFGVEAAANGGTATYSWNGNFKQGTFLYHSGSHGQLQVQMGLYGAISQDTLTGEAYTGISKVQTRDVILGAFDPAFNTDVNNGNFQSCTGFSACDTAEAAGQRTSTLNYNPRYFTVNGEPFIPSAPACITGINAGENTHLRLYNAAFRDFSPMMVGDHFDLVGEGGNAYQNSESRNTVILAALSTKDLIWNQGYQGTFTIFDRRLNVTTNGAIDGTTSTATGGLVACFDVGAAGGPDTTGPAVSNVQVSPDPSNGATSITVTAVADDSATGASNIAAAEYFIDTLGAEGTGTALLPADGTFDMSVENITATVNISTLTLGTHTVFIRARDSVTPTPNWGAAVGTTFTVSAFVANTPPTADAGGPYDGRISSDGLTSFPITFDCSASVDCSPTPCTSEGDTLTYSWDFGDTNSATGVSPTHAYVPTAATYPVTLTVNDGVNPAVIGTATTATMTINNRPVADPGGPYAPVGNTATLDGSLSSDVDLDILTYSWNFGDGNTGSGATPAHTWAAPGTYIVSLLVNDGFENSDADGIAAGDQPATTTVTVSGVGGGPVCSADTFNPNQSFGGNITVLAPGVLQNDTGANLLVDLPITVVQDNMEVGGILGFTDGAITFTPNSEKIGTLVVAYTATNTSGTCAPAQATINRELSVKKAEFKQENLQWNVQGSSTSASGTVTITLDGNGTVGTATIAGGNWSFSGNGPLPIATSTITVDDGATTGGIFSGIPVSIK